MNGIEVPDFRGTLRSTRLDELSWRPSAYAIVLRGDEVLVLPHLDGIDLPGGGIEFGESLEEGLLREVAEETGLDGYDPVLVGATSSYFRVEEDCIQSVMLYYRVLVRPGEPSTAGMSPWERQTTACARWLPLAELPDVHVTSTVDWRAYVPAAQAVAW